ncbi:kinesin [Cystoisospora suis]|uniref:Kinesin-like protein n=1 Tax=Cystoisospora suis TaxID=483139 RepID=A0A2C6KWS8_9APIC|nr:kinesin [Cystoisospora suis]
MIIETAASTENRYERPRSETQPFSMQGATTRSLTASVAHNVDRHPVTREYEQASASTGSSREDGGGCSPDKPKSLFSGSRNIQVVCRLRPRPAGAVASNHCMTLENGARTIRIQPPSAGASQPRPPPLDFTFDHVFDEQASQAAVFQKLGKPLVEAVCSGFNATVLAYGQSSSGKTHTIIGDTDDSAKNEAGCTPESRQQAGESSPPRQHESPRPTEKEGDGLLPRMIAYLFAWMKENQSLEVGRAARVSAVEIYNETVTDLISGKTGLRIQQQGKSGPVTVVGLQEEHVTGPAQTLAVLERTTRARRAGFTRMNAESSRSHFIFSITVQETSVATGDLKVGKLTVVDLAGSERIAKTGAVGTTLHEGTMINKCLTCLGKVIYALAALNEKQEKSSRPLISNLSTFVPYRDSKLTRVLQDSLGGNSNTCLILTCSQELAHVSESISTLRFGQRAMCVRNSPTVNLRKASEEEERLEHCLAESKAYIAKLTTWSEEALLRLAGGGAAHQGKDVDGPRSSQLPVSREAGRKAALSSPVREGASLFKRESLSPIEGLLALFPVPPESLKLGTNKSDFIARVRHRLQQPLSGDAMPSPCGQGDRRTDASASEVTSKAENDTFGKEGLLAPTMINSIPSDCPDPEWSAAGAGPLTPDGARDGHPTPGCETPQEPRKSPAGQQSLSGHSSATPAMAAGKASSDAACEAGRVGTALSGEGPGSQFEGQVAENARSLPRNLLEPARSLQPSTAARGTGDSASPGLLCPPRRSSFSLCPRRRECIAVLRQAVAKDDEYLASKKDSKRAEETLLAEEHRLLWQRLIRKLGQANRTVGWVTQMAGS